MAGIGISSIKMHSAIQHNRTEQTIKENNSLNPIYATNKSFDLYFTPPLIRSTDFP